LPLVIHFTRPFLATQFLILATPIFFASTKIGFGIGFGSQILCFEFGSIRGLDGFNFSSVTAQTSNTKLLQKPGAYE